jgi:hypothetical protein
MQFVSLSLSLSCWSTGSYHTDNVVRYAPTCNEDIRNAPFGRLARTRTRVGASGSGHSLHQENAFPIAILCRSSAQEAGAGPAIPSPWPDAMQSAVGTRTSWNLTEAFAASRARVSASRPDVMSEWQVAWDSYPLREGEGRANGAFIFFSISFN